MAGRSTQRGRRQKFNISVPAVGGGPGGGDWSIPQEVVRLGDSGVLSRAVLRAPAGSALTGAELKVFFGPNYDGDTNPEVVVDEDTAHHETAIVVAGHATTADLDKNIFKDDGGAAYDIRDTPVESMWVSIKNTAGLAQTNVIVSLEARDTL